MEKHELVDISGNITGKVLTHVEVRDRDNIPSGCYISVVGVVILNDKNEVLLQKRSRYKTYNPSKWGICGGKVDFNETTLQAGVRETLEEIGINLKQENLKFLSRGTVGKIYFTVYYIKQNVQINECTMQEEELEELQYFRIEELDSLDSEGFEWLDNLKKILSEGE